MKFLMFSAVAMLGLPVGDALAQSCTTPLSQSAVRTLVTGNYVCGSVGSDSWHELHQSTGVIRDYKKGPSDPIDPSKDVGTWTVNSTGTITYTYGTLSFTYQVAGTANPYSYCGIGGAPTLYVTIQSSLCP